MNTKIFLNPCMLNRWWYAKFNTKHERRISKFSMINKKWKKHNEIWRRESEMRDDLVEEVDGEINLLVRENKIEVVFQGHLLNPRFHFRVQPLFALKLDFQFLLFLFRGFWFDFGKSYKKVKKPVRPWLCQLGESYKKVIFIFMFKWRNEI